MTKFWPGRRKMVTGGGGFLGWHVVARPVNLGVGHEITIHELVTLIARLTRFDRELRWDPCKPAGQPRRALDPTRARERFGFVAGTPWEEGLRATIDWYESKRGAVS